MKKAGIALVIWGLLLSSCTSDTSDVAPPVESTVPGPTWPSHVSEEVANREPLPDCGQYSDEAIQSVALLPKDANKHDCFWSAYDAGGAAELRVMVRQIDTPPVPTYFRLYEDGRKEIISLSAEGSGYVSQCPDFVRRDASYPSCE